MLFQTLAPTLGPVGQAYQTLMTALNNAEKTGAFPTSEPELKKLSGASEYLGQEFAKDKTHDPNSLPGKFLERLTELQAKFEETHKEEASAVIKRLGEAFEKGVKDVMEKEK